MIIEKGDIYWYLIPTYDEFKSIPHPQVVIQDSVLNRSRINSVVVCGLTTNMKKATWPGNILLDINEANLSKQSIIDVSQVSVIKKNELGQYIGQLSANRISQIFSGMKLIQSLQEQRSKT